MDLVQVDVIGAEAAQAVLDLPHDPDARVPLVVASRTHPAVHLRGEDHLVAPALQRAADDLLGLAVGVHVGRVHEVDAAVDRRVDGGDAVVDVGVPHAPNIMVPRQCVLTFRPVPPSVRYSMRSERYHRRFVRRIAALPRLSDTMLP